MYALIIVALLGILLLYIGLFKKYQLLMPVGLSGLIAAQPVGDLDQQLVPGLMTVAVVDRLESVQVEITYRQHLV